MVGVEGTWFEIQGLGVAPPASLSAPFQALDLSLSLSLPPSL